LSSIISYGLSSLGGATGTGVSSLSSIISYGLSSLRNSITQNITSNIVTSNIIVSVETVTSLYNKVVLLDSDKNLKLYINDVYVSQYSNTNIIYSVYNNNELIVAVGYNDILYSRDGSNWNRAVNPRPSTTLWSVVYANNYWVATGSGGGNCLLYSRDGINWLQNPYSFPYTLNTIAYNSNNNYWIAGGENSYSPTDGDSRYTLYKINNITRNLVTTATSGGLGHRANIVEWGSSNWVATGKSFSSANKKVVYSFDGLNWLAASNIPASSENFFSDNSNDEGTGLAYANGVWIVGGANNLYRSVNGIEYGDITTRISRPLNNTDILPNNYEIYDIKYENGNNFYLTLRTTGSSGTQYIFKTINNGDVWSIISSNTSPQISRLALPRGSGPLSNTINVLINNGDIYTSNIYNSFHINTGTLFSDDISVSHTIKADIINADTLIVNNIPQISYGLSTVYSPYGVSSLSSIVSYGLSTVYSPYGVSSLSSIISYGLSTIYSPYGVSSLSSIISYGLSTVYSPYGI
jgi:hypothetical protein